LATLLQSAYERLKEYVLAQPVIGVDETHWKLLGEPRKKQGGKGKRWQAWAICCPDAVHYSFEDSRSAETAKQVLGDYAGIALTDGYAAYDSLKKQGGKFTQANCWAHVRRKFLEVEKQHPGKCETVLDLIGQLYEVERQARGKPLQGRDSDLASLRIAPVGPHFGQRITVGTIRRFGSARTPRLDHPRLRGDH